MEDHGINLVEQQNSWYVTWTILWQKLLAILTVILDFETFIDE